MVLSLLTKFRFSPNILLGFLYKVDHLLTGSEGEKKTTQTNKPWSSRVRKAF